MRIPTIKDITTAFKLAVLARKTDKEIGRAFYLAAWEKRDDKDDNIALATAILERFPDKITLENLNSCVISAAGVGLLQKWSILPLKNPNYEAVQRFYRTVRQHKLATEISPSCIGQALYAAAIARDDTLANIVFSFPQSEQMSTYALENALLYTLPAGHPDIKRIEPRKMGFEFGQGAPEMEAKIRKLIAAAEARAAANPLRFTL